MDSIDSYPVACGNSMFDILLSKNHHLIIPLTKERTLSLFACYFLIFSDWIVLAYVIGHLIDVIKDVYHQGRVHFFSYHWNYLAVASVTSFIIHYVIWWAGRAVLTEKPDSMKWESHATDHGYAIMLVSYCFLAVGILLAFAQNLSFVQANSSTGPLLHAFIQMLIDVAKFFLYFVFVFIAFAVSFTKLYLQYEKARRHFLLNNDGNKSNRSFTF